MIATAKAFGHFVETHFKFSHWASRQRDGARRRPQVTPAYIFRALVYQTLLGLDSLLALDQWLRAPHAPRLLHHHGKRRGSDTTLSKALAAWQLAGTRRALDALYLWLRDQGWLSRTLSGGRPVHSWRWSMAVSWAGCGWWRWAWPGHCGRRWMCSVMPNAARNCRRHGS